MLAQTSQGLANLPVENPEYYHFGIYESRSEAYRGSHGIAGGPEEFGAWISETQGDEFAREFAAYMEQYEKRFGDALARIEGGARDSEVPFRTVEVDSPVECFYSRILAAGSWDVVRGALVEFVEDSEYGLGSVQEEGGPELADMAEPELVALVRACVEHHNERQ